MPWLTGTEYMCCRWLHKFLDCCSHNPVLHSLFISYHQHLARVAQRLSTSLFVKLISCHHMVRISFFQSQTNSLSKYNPIRTEFSTSTSHLWCLHGFLIEWISGSLIDIFILIKVHAYFLVNLWLVIDKRKSWCNWSQELHSSR